MKYLYGRGTDPQATQAAQANSILTAGSAGQQHYDRRQRRPTALWPQAAQANRIIDAGRGSQILTFQDQESLNGQIFYE